MGIEDEKKKPYQPTEEEMKAAEQLLDDEIEQDVLSEDREKILNAKLSELGFKYDIIINETGGKIYKQTKKAFISSLTNETPDPHEITSEEALSTLDFYEREVREDIDREEAKIKNIQALKQRVVKLKEEQEKK